MSALGQKQTYAPQNIMSALPPIATRECGCSQRVMSALPLTADMCSALDHLRLGPIADIPSYSITSSAMESGPDRYSEARTGGHRQYRDGGASDDYLRAWPVSRQGTAQ